MKHCRCATAQHGVAAGGTLVFALMPKFGCPLCAPVLAAALGVVGVPFEAASWILTMCAAACVAMAAYLVARDWPRSAAAWFALVAALILLIYRLFPLPDSMRYFGTAAFGAALIWRAWARLRLQRSREVSLSGSES